jgi:hypothetical protein
VRAAGRGKSRTAYREEAFQDGQRAREMHAMRSMMMSNADARRNQRHVVALPYSKKNRSCRT